ncbi:MAG: M23 family metallopeptidase [Proteobacteria bacterium]|nr:M23 family metallopeptidase [Pseudomonadota bacterium]
MSNRFYTVLIIPENSSKPRQFHVPSWTVRAALAIIPVVILIGITLFLDYRFVANQVYENRELQSENRRLRQSVQLYQSRMEAMESSLDRIENFSARLKMITNLMDKDQLSQRLELPPPDAATNLSFSLRGEESAPADSSSRKEDRSFEKLSLKALTLEQNLHDLHELLSDQKSFLNALPTKKPAEGYFTSGFGVRMSPLGESTEKMHEGLDIANGVGTPIKAPARGTVLFAGKKSGYGQIVILDHGYGLETWYGHTSRMLVRPGMKVKRGQTIALIGNSGHSTGSHLHYEVRVHGIPVDPLAYILEN